MGLLATLLGGCIGISSASNTILFAGDSDIELWKYTNQLYPNSVNRGDGGSTCQQWTNRIDRFLTKFKPSTVVLVCGENDLAEGDSPAQVFRNFQKLVTKITESGASVVYLGTKPEPSTKRLHSKYRSYDALIREYYEQQETKNLVMIDVYPSFVELGNPRNLYARDRLHLSKNGYNYWNLWLQASLDDTSGCKRWQSGSCVLRGETNDSDNGSVNEDGNNSGSTSSSNDAPTEPPTSVSTSSSTECSDDESFRFRERKRMDCRWVGKRPDQRCRRKYKKQRLWEYCPDACDEC